MRILVLGTAGSGKSTLAKVMAKRLACDWLELDDVYWGPGWIPIDRDDFRLQVRTFAEARRSWVIDGSYRSVRSILLSQADLVVWLDPQPWRILWRITWRTTVRAIRRDIIAGGNQESLRTFAEDRFAFARWALAERYRLQTELAPASTGIVDTRIERCRTQHDVDCLMGTLPDVDTEVDNYHKYRA